MRKFAVMIIGVSMVFFVLGGIARPFLDRFKSEKREFTFTRQASDEIGEDNKVEEVTTTLRPVSNDGQTVRIRVMEPATVIEQQLPSKEKQVVEFQRVPSPEELPQTEELPRVHGKNVVIIKRVN